MGQKTVLLTNIFVSQFTGSELDTLQTARWFLRNGWDVEVATLHKSEPLLHMFEECGIKVTFILDEELSRKHYDLLWGHHWPLINHLVYHRLAEFTKVVHFCLGPKEALECAVPYHEYLSAYFTISEEVKKSLIEIDGVSPEKIFICPNSADKDLFEQYKYPVDRPLQKICVITNHVAPEVGQLKELFAPYGIDIEYVGLESTPKLVTVDLLQSYDLIITIGRTVQQCFACGIPVYCYDCYGGPGYINGSNLDAAERNNFSGRGFDRIITAAQILEDILTNYKRAQCKVSDLHDIAAQRYCFDTNMNRNLMDIETCVEFNIASAAMKYRQYKRPNDAFIIRWRNEVGIPGLIQENNYLRGAFERENERVRTLTNDIQQKERELESLRAEAENILHSRSYRLARKLSRVYGVFKR